MGSLSRADKEDYALFLGASARVRAHTMRSTSLSKRAHTPQHMAGKVDPGRDADYFKKRIKPYIDGENIVYEDEVDGEQKRELLAGARVLLFPTQRKEPFGSVMIEGLDCGTPVVAAAMGSAPEIVKDGEAGVWSVPASGTRWSR